MVQDIPGTPFAVLAQCWDLEKVRRKNGRGRDTHTVDQRVEEHGKYVDWLKVKSESEQGFDMPNTPER